MDFGKTNNLEDIDFSLPADHPANKMVPGMIKRSDFALYSGCAKWGRTEWIGKLYPEGTKEKDFLAHYVKHFNSIELNTTHYRVHPSSTLKKWSDTSPEGFRFCPKFPKSISHSKKLLNAEEDTWKFYESVRAFEDKLGPAFLQLPPAFGPEKLLVLDKYLRDLPIGLTTFVELRHPGWFAEPEFLNEALAVFREYGVGTVITDTSGRRDVLHMALTTPVAFIRFVGNDLHPSDYERLDSWIEKLGEWKEKGLKEAYFFMHQHAELDSPKLAAYFARKMNLRFKLGLPEPEFVDPAYGNF